MGRKIEHKKMERVVKKRKFISCLVQGTADKCKFVGETVRHFNAGKVASFELFAPGTKKTDVNVNIISKLIIIMHKYFFY